MGDFSPLAILFHIGCPALTLRASRLFFSAKSPGKKRADKHEKIVKPPARCLGDTRQDKQGFRERKIHINTNIFARFSRDCVGGLNLFLRFWGLVLIEGEKHKNNPGTIPRKCCLCFFFCVRSFRSQGFSRLVTSAPVRLAANDNRKTGRKGHVSSGTPARCPLLARGGGETLCEFIIGRWRNSM